MRKQKQDNPTFSASGRSLLEILWEELDLIMDNLMSEGEPEPSNPKEIKELNVFDIDALIEQIEKTWMLWGELRGQAQGVTYAIAVITDPYSPKVSAVKEVAMKRWESRQDGGLE